MKLNKKLDNLTQDTPKYHGNTRRTYNPNRVINLSSVNFTGEQLKTLSLGPQFAIEREPRHYINHLIIDTDNAIRQLDSNIQNAFRYFATKRIQQIKTPADIIEYIKEYNKNNANKENTGEQ